MVRDKDLGRVLSTKMIVCSSSRVTQGLEEKARRSCGNSLRGIDV